MDAYAAYPSLELDRPAQHVLRLTLRAAGKLNAVSGAMHSELAVHRAADGVQPSGRPQRQPQHVLRRAIQLEARVGGVGVHVG